MKLSTLSILCTASLLLLSGCVSPEPEPQQKAVTDSSLPLITLTKNGIIRDMKTIAFEWKSIQDPRVNAVYVYKRDFKNQESQKLEYFTTIDNRFQTHFVDSDNQPDSKYSYAFRAIAKDAKGELSQVYTVNTLPVLQSVAWIHSIAGLPRMAKIIWRPHLSERVNRYIIERKTYDDEEWEEIETLKGRLNAEYIDTDLEDGHIYLYRVRVETFDNIVSTPSEIVKVVTKALPSSITQIDVTKNLPKKIMITWNKSNVKDFERYYLYRSDTKDGNYELIAKLYNNRFEDDVNEDGKAYFYRVSVVDKDGLESQNDKHTAMGMTLPKPQAPTVVEAMQINNQVRLTWNKNDARVKYYRVIRKHNDGWFKVSSKKYDHITGTVLVDKNIKPDTTYTYTVYGVDANGIVSEASPEAKVITKESTSIIDAPKDESVEKEVKPEPVEVKEAPQTQEVISPVQDLDLNEI